jgi:hypothetical protein
MAASSFLPTAFRWVFTVLEVLAGLAAVCLIIVTLVNPSLPPGAKFGPVEGQFLDQPASMALHAPATGEGNSEFVATIFDGKVTLRTKEAAGFIELLKEYGLPTLLVYAIFLAALFDVLRRLFRNVGRGQSFTPQSVQLVQIVGGSLIAFSILSGIAESWFAHAAYSYLAGHTDITISGTLVHLPPPAGEDGFRYGHPSGSGFWSNHDGIHFDHLFGTTFWCGLLVLALAEVFRQGLALKRDNELTV